MTQDVAIRIEGLAKDYVIGGPERASDSFREMLSGAFAGLLGNSPAGPAQGAQGAQQFWALQDIDLEIRRGEVVGIIGRNGAGKSTLLKILSRITEPTTGRIELHGRTASLLEVGTGFHPELTGRENIYLNGAILGMSRAEVKRSFDEIVTFAEVEKFLDTPVKRYSSGMYTRLAFAVAAHLDADILMVDEVLAVGDVAFQRKCLGAMERLSGSGRTILFVSHNMSAVERLCSRAVVLDGGRVRFAGATPAAIASFLSSVSSVAEAVPMSGPLQKLVSIRSLTINGSKPHERIDVLPDKEISFVAMLDVLEPVEKAKIVVSVRKGEQKVVELYDVAEPQDLPRGMAEITASLPAHFLSPGDYSVGIGCFSQSSNAWTIARGLGRLSVLPVSSGRYDIGNMGLVHLVDRGERRLVGVDVAAA